MPLNPKFSRYKNEMYATNLCTSKTMHAFILGLFSCQKRDKTEYVTFWFLALLLSQVKINGMLGILRQNWTILTCKKLIWKFDLIWPNLTWRWSWIRFKFQNKCHHWILCSNFELYETCATQHTRNLFLIGDLSWPDPDHLLV